MKRSFVIISSIIIVLILVAVWVYILFFKGQNTEQNAFTNLGFGDTTDTSFPTPVEDSTSQEQVVVDVSGSEKIRQLTTRPIAGYQDVTKSTSSAPVIYYVESGTGHIFSINLKSGEEKRVSGTTIPNCYFATITPNGKYVMLQSGSGNNAEFIVGEINPDSESISVYNLEEKIVSFTEAKDDTFLYAVKTNNSIIGRQYDPSKKSSKELFTIPFREAIIKWGSDSNDTHYIYPKATSQLEGYAYIVSKNSLQRLPISGYGLSLSGNADGVIYSKQVENKYQSFVYNKNTGITNQAPFVVIPEKCSPVPTNTASMICGGTITNYDYTMPDSWYKGNVSFSDELWQIDTTTGVGNALVDIVSETGRQVDTTSLKMGGNNERLYFINSTDNMLWVFDSTGLVN